MMGGGRAEANPSGFGNMEGDSPWGGGARDSELAREAGIDDIGGAREDRQGWFDTAQNDPGEDIGGDGGFGGDSGGDS